MTNPLHTSPPEPALPELSPDMYAARQAAVGEELLLSLAPGEGTPLHYHPDCEERIELRAGSGQLEMAGDIFILHSGQSASVGVNLPHRLLNTGTEPLAYQVAHVGHRRRTVFVWQSAGQSVSEAAAKTPASIKPR